MASGLIQRAFLGVAALACGAACAIAAYASHVADMASAKRLLIAAAFMLVHALAYFSLRHYGRWIEYMARVLLMFALMFSFSVLSIVIWHWRPLLAPYAGGGLIVTWLALTLMFLFTKLDREKQ